MTSTRARPNILWLMTDEQRSDSLGCYGSPWARTPNVDAIARDGVVFTQAVTPCPMCVPARLSILTGKYPCELGVWNNKFCNRDEDHLTYLFKDAGYRTASFGKQHYGTSNQAFDREVTFDLSDEVGYLDYNARHEESRFDVIKYKGKMPWIMGGVFPAYPTETQESRVVELGKKYLEELIQKRGDAADAPFFLRLSFNGPHTPVSVPQPFDTLIPEDSIILPERTLRPRGDIPDWARELRDTYSGSHTVPAELYRRTRRYYYGYVSYIDYTIGEMLGWMDQRGLLDNTIVLFLSDHGTHLGDYGFVQKQTFYEPVVNVPFILKYPGRLPGGVRIAAPVETRMLLPTLLELAGLDAPIRFAHNPLLEALGSNGNPGGCPSGMYAAYPVFSEMILNSVPSFSDTRVCMVRRGKWKLTAQVSPAGAWSNQFLHDMEADPYEERNLFGLDAFSSTAKDLSGVLAKHILG